MCSKRAVIHGTLLVYIILVRSIHLLSASYIHSQHLHQAMQDSYPPALPSGSGHDAHTLHLTYQTLSVAFYAPSHHIRLFTAHCRSWGEPPPVQLQHKSQPATQASSLAVPFCYASSVPVLQPQSCANFSHSASTSQQLSSCKPRLRLSLFLRPRAIFWGEP